MLYCLREMGCMMAKPSGENLYEVIVYVQLLGKHSSDSLINYMMLVFNCLQTFVHLINIVVLSRKGGIACFACETVQACLKSSNYDHTNGKAPDPV